MKHIKHIMHGESKTRLYRIWSNLKNRVLPNSAKSKYYFDRGIGLCEEWKNSFESFRDWSINNGYNDKLTLDRIDNDGNYCPNNCRWVDMKTQANNRSNNIIVYADKESIPFSEICRVLNIDYKTAYGKVVRHLAKKDNVKESVSEDLEEVGKEWLIPQLDKSYEPYGERKMMELTRFDGYAMLDAVEFGAKWHKEQMMAKAVGVEVKVDDGGYPYIPQMELYDYDKDVPLAKEGDKYKVILIKEE